MKALKQQAKSKADLGVEISIAFTRRPDDLNTALTRIEREIPKDAKDAPYGDVLYDTIFNEKVAAALDSKGLKGLGGSIDIGRLYGVTPDYLG